ncbi:MULTISPECIES: hypothetical protein [Virgibacillus]|uniref:Uncharacterized protein n=2 Tax=Virgibacillus TaxID=84406 RepID=A0A024Q9Y1_9BACI|nr:MULTISPECIES: hypothetical protein [Virgibacillus]EQB37714.1 hypothetical protein M948_03925 [Virgibacillus sp. CM-4]MYL40450.1 hypothetical protein [Virgibacillus massiliensis]GGJ58867.1 hypothetical protein GCM10007111_21120 [Virgibacillus kapii]CDQ38761.1 hypothetical protein BN990_01035 [Virgibacillus massiliensis]
MAITVPVPTLGDVIVLTYEGDQVETGCTAPGEDAPEVKNFSVEQGNLYIIGCNNFPIGGGTVAYIVDAQNIDLGELIQAILGLAVVQGTGGKTNIFTAV